MFQCQYNRQSFNPKNPKQWKPLESYGYPVSTYEEAQRLMRAFKQAYKHEMGEPCTLQLRVLETN